MLVGLRADDQERVWPVVEQMSADRAVHIAAQCAVSPSRHHDRVGADSVAIRISSAAGSPARTSKCQLTEAGSRMAMLCASAKASSESSTSSMAAMPNPPDPSTAIPACWANRTKTTTTVSRFPLTIDAASSMARRLVSVPSVPTMIGPLWSPPTGRALWPPVLICIIQLHMPSLSGRERRAIRTTESAVDSIGTIEMELLTLVRHLETLGRKSSLYVEVDRAGYLALRTLDQLGPVPTNTLAEALQLDASTVTRQVNALVTSGFVERRPNPADGRSSSLSLTRTGLRTMREVERERHRMLKDMVSDWDEAERRDLGHALTKLNLSLIDQVAGLNPRHPNSQPVAVGRAGTRGDSGPERMTGRVTQTIRPGCTCSTFSC